MPRWWCWSRAPPERQHSPGHPTPQRVPSQKCSLTTSLVTSAVEHKRNIFSISNKRLHMVNGLTLTDRNDMTRAAMSPNMWKLSATSAIELVTYPTMISTKKKNAVSHIIESRRHFFPEYLDILEKLQKRTRTMKSFSKIDSQIN